jgi:hypothetical protein
MIDALTRDPNAVIAAILGNPGEPGPPGDPGTIGAPLRIDASLASTWILTHSLGRIPAVQLFLATGEQVLTDTVVDNNTLTVIFATPQSGFVIII